VVNDRLGNMSIYFCGITFNGLTRESCLVDDGEFKQIVTVNSEFIVRAQMDDKFRNLINHCVATFDGQIPFLLAKSINTGLMFEKISGSDFIYDACEYAKKNNKKIFLLGGAANSNEIAIQKLRERYGVNVEGYSPPYSSYPFSEELNAVIFSKIEKFNPHFIFVGFGAVKQEYWIQDHRSLLEKAGVRCAVGSGGAFEFVSGHIRRAPKLIQQFGLEGLWRFAAEPNWMRFKRLLISLKIFYYFVKNFSGLVHSFIIIILLWRNLN
jgi:N-acetylglucosaminyldiphosphoundecaprenol N-acetyl-beta-D-mannosaminyltransferase